jgi:hypothetical protein
MSCHKPSTNLIVFECRSFVIGIPTFTNLLFYDNPEKVDVSQHRRYFNHGKVIRPDYLKSSMDEKKALF